MTDAHKTESFAELVCSNSFRSDDNETNAVGLLHEEMRRLGSLIMAMADAHQVPAGSALAWTAMAFFRRRLRKAQRPSADPHRARRKSRAFRPPEWTR